MIPIYRAKKIDSDEWVEGNYLPLYYYGWHDIDIENIIYNNSVLEGVDFYEIDPNTLAIHFQNMIDKNGKKIFASLSEDGLGGDEYKTVGDHTYIVYFKNGAVCGGISYDNCIPLGWEADLDDLDVGNGETRINDVDFVEVIGIHKGE